MNLPTILGAAGVALFVWVGLGLGEPPIALLAGVVAMVGWGYWRLAGGGRRRWLVLTPTQLDELTGEAFEQWLTAVLQEAGFAVAVTPKSKDFGVDVVAQYRGQRIGIQAKKRKGKNVGNAAVQEVNAGCDYHDCPLAAVVTQSRFTASARAQADRLARPCLLIGRDELRELPKLLKQLAEADR